ncbi:hypothetical protein K435DRAFT_339667 [Dendrothele bispora CBS 962.96]|uniref:Uncharacterized protein n=1 Tax=Dendrothele bispora (strain CBS 962.96) TaxID=1314807 RepID=A0A4V4HHG2_DENBC|nr:hypothetical protein K435DRAFT_339667 [Dendrothele bispora CBS 962.96]
MSHNLRISNAQHLTCGRSTFHLEDGCSSATHPFPRACFPMPSSMPISLCEVAFKHAWSQPHPTPKSVMTLVRLFVFLFLEIISSTRFISVII